MCIRSLKENLQYTKFTLCHYIIIEYFRDCEEAYEYGMRKSGIYTVQPDDDAAFEVYCDMETDSGGWTVFQRRKDGSEDFYRDWMDYARGFGNLTDEFWLGLRKIHRITSLSAGAAGNELRVDLEDFEGNTAFAKYMRFNVGSSSQQYALTVGSYSGMAGDSMGRHNGYKFTTKDIDNDGYSANCALLCKGGWWYDYCHNSNLNGLYLGGDHSTEGDGVNWRYWKGYYYSLKSTEMKVRRL